MVLISNEMLQTFKNSLRLNRKYAVALSSVSNEEDTKKHKEAIKNIDVILAELEKYEEVD